jgi:beta-N-acetylhexosaminidase
VQYYDDYIDALITYAEENPDFAERVDESVTRILRLKEKYGILDMDVSGDDVDQKVADAQKTIGSEEHHAVESSIAKQAITLLKNDNYALPLSGHEGNVVIFGRDSDHVKTIEYAIQQMQATGLIDEDAYVVNLENGTTTGSSSSDVRITIGFYRDYPEGGNPVVHYTDEMKQAVAEADSVVTLSVNYNLAALQPTADQYQGVSQIMDDAHAVGASFVLLSCNLPYDAARYQGADAIMCCYMSAGLDAGPIDSGAGKLGAYNANVVCALESMFDAFAPAGTLPVNAPAVTEAADGTISYSSEVLYERGSGIKSFNYAFVEGTGGVYEQGSATGLHFKANARHDKLVSLQVDGAEPDAASYAISAGSTNVDLSADYLDTLAAGEHQIDAIYEYGTGEFAVSTTFTVTTKASPTPTPTPDVNPDSTKGSSVTTKGASAKSATTGDAVPVIAIVIIVLVAIVAIVLALVARKRQGSSDAVDDDR